MRFVTVCDRGRRGLIMVKKSVTYFMDGPFVALLYLTKSVALFFASAASVARQEATISNRSKNFCLPNVSPAVR